MAELTPVDRVRVAHACEDHAAQWRQNPLVGGDMGSVARYVAEGNLGRLCDRHTLNVVWAAVRQHLDANPDVLAVGPLTDSERAAVRASREKSARALLEEAEVPFRAGRWDDALALVDQAELVAPDAVDFGRFRQVIAERRDGR
ncbi:hypothetical protein [Micromonospora tulbaghiae]|uniref:hypothetical protein n=1 Tax=Micromonospora tulbaghiae TaxID=479978 RepID=UPI0033E8B2A7